jgi:hypothetical protein
MSQGRGRATVAPSAAALLAATLLAGCSSTTGFDGPDPLTGGPAIQRRSSPAPSLAAGLASTPPPGAASPAGQLPPVPTPSTATSQAALASGMTQPLDSSRDLRIGAPTAMPADQPLWRGTESTAQPAQPGVRLSDPQAANIPPPSVPGPVATPTGIPTTPAVVLTGGGIPVDALDQALRQLRTGRQVTWVRLETLDNGGWRFRCAIANPANPNSDLNYDATGATEVDAVRKVLDQIAVEKR